MLVLAYAMRRAWRVARDPLKLSRFRWLAMCWVITCATLAFGIGFSIAGPHLVLAKGAFAIYARIPGGLYTHGFIMLALGILLTAGLALPTAGHQEPRRYLMYVLRVTTAYYAWSLGLFILAPAVDDGAFSYVAVVTWTVMSLFPTILCVAPPPHLVPRDETDLIRAAIGVGIDTQTAAVLARSFYSVGGAHERHR